MRVIRRILLLAALLLAPAYGLSAATAAEAENKANNEEAVLAPEPIQRPPGEDISAEEIRFPLFRVLGGLGLALTLIVAGFFAAKRFFPQYFTRGEFPRTLKIIETLPMGDRRSIALIQFANSRFLVGNTPHQINLLTTLQDQVSLASELDGAAAQSRSPAQKESRSPFRNMFEVEKNRSSQFAGSPLPEEVRNKMRRLREALEK